MTQSRYVSRLRFLSGALGASVLLISSVILAGVWLDLPALEFGRPGLTTMKANAALCLMLLGLALTILNAAKFNAGQFIVRSIGVLVVLASTSTLLEFAFGGDLCIDHLLFRGVLGPGNVLQPGHTSPIEAVMFLFAGCGLVFLENEEKWVRQVSQGLLLVAGACSLAVLLGYVHANWTLAALGERARVAAMALPTAACCLLVSVGGLCARPDRGVMTILTSEGPGGTVARRLVPIILLLPIALDLLGTGVQRVVKMDLEAGSMISAILAIVLALAFVYSISRLLDWKDSERRRAQKAVQASEARYQQIIEGSHEGIAVMDLAGRILRINPRLGEMLGRPARELVGTSIFSVMDAANIEIALSAIGRYEQKPRDRYDLHLLHKNGSSICAWVSSSRVQDEDGGFVSVVWLVEDITAQELARAALAASEARFRTVTETASDAIVSVNEAGQIVLWNRAAQRVFGYTEAEIIGRPSMVLVPEESGEALKESLNRIVFSGQAGLPRDVVELTGRRKDGSKFPGELSVAVHKTEMGTSITAIIRDITERKKADAEREMLLASLENALTEVKTLSGIIPICSGCKKIRNDKGFWDQVETYISKHSEAHFSHGLCPECLQKYYPEFTQKN